MDQESVLKNFAKFTKKHLYQSLFFNKVQGLRLVQNTILLKQASFFEIQNITDIAQRKEFIFTAKEQALNSLFLHHPI